MRSRADAGRLGARRKAGEQSLPRHSLFWISLSAQAEAGQHRCDLLPCAGVQFQDGARRLRIDEEGAQGDGHGAFGVGLPDDAIHAPNERFDLAQFYGGIETMAYLYDELAEALG